MKYGPNSDAVQEILEFFLHSGKLLRGSPPFPQAITVVRDVSRIPDYWGLPEDAPEDTEAWLDIKVSAGTFDPIVILRILDQLDNYGVLDPLMNLFKGPDFYDQIALQISHLCNDLVINNIVGDMEMLCMTRAAFGTGNRFIETMFQVYQSGGFPCGWDGLYPQGRLAVYYPSESGSA